jgi:Protein of unknown function (DUF4043)
MALTAVSPNNKLVLYRKEIYREYIRQNLFAPYIGPEMTAIIRVINDLKKGGEQINIPLIARLKTQPIAVGTLVGNEEQIDNYGDRMWIDWARNAVRIAVSEEQKSSIDLFGQARPLLEDWGKEVHRDELVDTLYSIPQATSPPAGLGSTNGQRVNGIAPVFGQTINQWVTDNQDRVLFGGTVGNFLVNNFQGSLANVSAAMTLSASLISKAKRLAKLANPRIRPYKLKNGREYFVMFANSLQFRDCKADPAIINANTQARPREGDGLDKNPLFQDGDVLWDGVIVREIPEMTVRLPSTYQTGGGAGIQVAPAFLCGQGAVAWAWGRMPMPTFLREDDYQFYRGVGIQMAYGMKKIAKLAPAPAPGGTQPAYKEWGVFTAFTAAQADA